MRLRQPASWATASLLVAIFSTPVAAAAADVEARPGSASLDVPEPSADAAWPDARPAPMPRSARAAADPGERPAAPRIPATRPTSEPAPSAAPSPADTLTGLEAPRRVDTSIPAAPKRPVQSTPDAGTAAATDATTEVRTTEARTEIAPERADIEAEAGVAPEAAIATEAGVAARDDTAAVDELAAFRGAHARREWARPFAPAASDAEIGERITRHTPVRAGAGYDGWLPRGLHARLRSAWGAFRESVADFEGARGEYEHAIALGADDWATWRGLARTRVRTGEREAAEAALLAAERAAAATPGVSPLVRADTLRELGELYLAMGFPDAAAIALDRALDLAPGATRAQQLFAVAAAASETGDEPLAPAQPIALWPPTRAEQWRTRIESGLDGLFAHAPAGLRDTVEQRAGAQTAVLLGAALGVLLVVWVALRLTRKTGDVVVEITFPDELEGLFSVRLGTRPGLHRRLGAHESADAARRKSTRLCHYAVSRETHFLRLPARRYWVTVQGTLSDAAGAQVIAEPFEEQSVDVVGNETTRIEFDLAPRECPVDVTVLWDKRGAGEVGVVARGYPQSLRYQTNGKVRLRVPMGAHTIVVGSGDRIAECEVDVQSHKPTPVEINLAGSQHLVFKGCPPAVEPYLHGDLNGAARALERDGHDVVANLLLARLHQEQGQTERAAERLERAGHHLEAARLRESISDFERAATLFENAGDARQAAATWRAAGDLRKAGQLYQSVGDHESAIECFRSAGATSALIGVLEHQGRYFDAARIAMDDGDRAGAIRLLQQVPRNDPAHPDACLQLVEAFEKEGHVDLAARKLEEYVGVVGAATSPDVCSHLAELLTKGDEPGRALEILEALREREPTYPNIASRIEALRKIVSSRRLDDGGPATTTATLVSDQRYEIIEEIGRGGMGLIFKARDRRLGRIVALKRLPENLREHPKALHLFLNEAQAAARLNHPNIVTIYDTDQEDGAFFITMELLQGMPLNHVLRERGRLGPRDTARIGVQVARGLQYAHDQQIVHRDVKTANLFLTRDKVVKIMDFGLAKIIEEVRRGSTVIGGTPSYMAPEQSAGNRVDHRADLYALGVTLFELVTGRLPFDKGDVAYHHRHTPPPDPRELVGGLPDALVALIARLLEKDPAARCATAAEVEQALERIVHP